jgi:hypothetical protein
LQLTIVRKTETAHVTGAVTITFLTEFRLLSAAFYDKWIAVIYPALIMLAAKTTT